MAKVEYEVIDSQFIAENISFLDNCFDNSFTLQSTLQIVKEYATEQGECPTVNINGLRSRKNSHVSQNTTLLLERTRDSPAPPPISKTNRNLKDWGLPSEIAKKYEDRGINEMFEWQVTCLGNPKVLFECRNLVYSAPTSAGKTLVAEILTIKTILERQKKVIIILPFVSIVREKMFYLQEILSSSGIRVEGFMGSQSPPGGLQTVHVAICTIEKANGLVNRLLDEGNISDLGAVIVDELHLLGDPHRGYILELLLTKIKYVCSRSENVQIQIVGMSATLPNLEILANWLNAELFITQFRPIPLDEYCLVGNNFYDKLGKSVNIAQSNLMIEGDNVLKICFETISQGCSVLIFCMTKNWCESLAQSIAMSFYKIGSEETDVGTILRGQLRTECIVEVLEQLKNCPVGLDQVLKKTISFGVSYHHAGLTFDERDIIEGAFKSGAIRVLVATSTLSSGVNLPARKVIIRSPVFQRRPINILTYKQMIGRAGRMGKDTKGESILVCTEVEKKIGFDLMMGALDPVKSCIETEDKYMRAVLEMIASQVLCTRDELHLYSRCTLLHIQQEQSNSQNFLLENTLEELKNFELIRVQTEDEEEHYVATPLGKACLSSSMAPNDGLSLFCELQKARQCLVLETDLHLIYLVTPYSVSSQWGEIDWLHLLTLWESLTKAMKRVGELVGVQESFIIRCVRGNNKSNNIQSKMSIHKRFYTALALQDLVNEVPLSEVATKFQCARGFLQNLQQGAATFAGMFTAFCRQLGWKNMEMLISQFQDRLHFGIHSDLLELMKLPSLNGMRARTLFDAGYETISSIASANTNAIENILHKAIPFQSEKVGDHEDNVDVRKRNKIKSIWVTGCCGMTTKEAAKNLISEARKYLVHEIGVAEIKWENKSIDNCNISNSVCPDIVNDLNHQNGVNNIIDEIINPKQKLEHVQNMSKSNIAVAHSVDTKSSNISTFRNTDTINHTVNHNDLETTVNKSNCMNLHTETIPNETANGNVNKEMQSTNAVTKVNPNVSDSPCLEAKDEIVWGSLNLTEVAIDSVTKLRTSDTMFSPNISFGEVEEKCAFSEEHVTSSKCNSSKDISLFSSEGDNSSLFEESLPLDLIPSKLLDKERTVLCKQDTASDYLSIHSNTILDAFKSTLVDVDEDEDIKLVYEDDNRLGNSVSNQNGGVAAGTKPVNNFTSPLKRRKCDNKEMKPITKKKRVENLSVDNNIKNTLPDPSFKSQLGIKCALSKTFNVEIKNYRIDCYLLRKEDIVNNLCIMDTLDNVSFYLDVNKSKSFVSHELIGSNIVDIPKSVGNIVEKTDRSVIKGFSIYSSRATCLYYDISTLNDIQTLENVLREWLTRQRTGIKILCSKTTNLYIKRWLNVNLPLNYVDVSLLEWLIDNDEKIPNIDYLAKIYLEIDITKHYVKINNQLKIFNSLETYETSCIRAWLISMISDKQKLKIMKNFIAEKTIDVERHVSSILANCEHYGITVDKDLASRLLIDVRNSQETLQKKAYKICGYHFNFNSSKDVAKVLGIYNGRKVSTRKSVISSHNTPMSSIVIYWRKLNSILTKTLYPLTEQACIYSEGDRINPSYTMFTCTGRISMHEPNLQNVPRTFCIPSEYLTPDNNGGELVDFNCRNIFKAAQDYVIVSADYCQLEMRILTHFSRDPVLTNVMKSTVDVFKAIAASWSNTPEEQVDDDLRQKAKQLCYGIIYGMGNRTLSQHLDVSELDAAMFMDTFYKTYPAISTFTQSVIDGCRRTGFVETLTKRRRYLPDIRSNVASKRSAAERQAVNTTIQGSAADIAKAAMCAIDSKTNSLEPKPRLILQMHDELIYEVPETRKHTFMVIMKDVMEKTMKLRVPLPVKVKTGYTWGSLNEVNC